MGNSRRTRHYFKLNGLAVVTLCATIQLAPSLLLARNAAQSSAQNQTSISRHAGTIKSVNGNTIVLASDAGSEITIVVPQGARIIAVTPGQKDLQSAQAMQFTDLHPGDRILVRGVAQTDGKTVLANSVLAMKKSEVINKQARDREDWQKNGIGGLVRAVDPETVTVSLLTPTGAKDVVIRVGKSTIIRRYAPDSVQFDKAVVSSLDQIKPGDQLRARGTHGPADGEFSASEIVTGSFRNVAGTISAIDSAAGSIRVEDLATKQSVQVKITQESQIRKLPPPLAQRIALRLKGNSSEDPSSLGAEVAGRANGRDGQEHGGAPDLQQMIVRMPPSTLADFQKGDAVMIVATQGTRDTFATAIILLGGVEPILSTSPKGEASSLLSPWSLSTGGGDSIP